MAEVGTGLGNLPILGSCPAGSPDGADDFAVDNNREATLDRGRSAKAERSHTDAALRDQIFKDSARPAKVERRLCLVLGDANRTVLRVIELVGYPGIFGKRCLSPPSSTHGWALSQKISIPGFTQLESSSVPAMIIATLGMTSASSIRVDPHSGQKRR